jgi:5-deoxy-D-glucuronate isomerase
MEESGSTVQELHERSSVFESSRRMRIYVLIKSAWSSDSTGSATCKENEVQETLVDYLLF